ncbi:MAG: diphthine synthase [Candidatus Bathyarchaeia archaeon]
MVGGMLRLIGLGLYGEGGISVQGMSEARMADQVFAEFYTSVIPGLSLERLEASLGKRVRVLSRRDIEERAEEVLLGPAREGDVAVLVPGDPVTATTHVDLLLRARKLGVEASLTHAASVATAIAGATGLQYYKFGRTVTLPMAAGGGFPASPYVEALENFKRGLHTLILLDLDAERGLYMSVREALAYLVRLEVERRGGLATPDRLLIGAARVGAPDADVKGGTMESLTRHDFGGPPYCLVLPGRLHFVEAEALRVLVGVERRLLEGSM